jgi:cell division protein FtsB
MLVKKLFAIVMVMMMIFGMVGCSKGGVTQEAYDSLQEEFNTSNAENTELQAENDKLTAEKTELQTKVDTLTTENEALKAQAETTKAVEEEPVLETMTSSELEAKLLEQPMYVVSTDYLIQSEEYKSLYPDMLSAVIKNNSGSDVKNAVIAFVAWDENSFPVKIVGQFDFDEGSYVKTVDFGDVNMVDGSTYGEDMGMSLNEKCDNIKTIKAITMQYTDFDGNTWENPYYNTWVDMYEDKQLKD